MSQLHLLTADGHRLAAEASPGSSPAVVICHPDPRLGGDRHHSVVDALYRTVTGSGRAAIRFDFRPDPADHLESLADLRAAIDHIVARPESATPEDDHRADASTGVHIVGYSFGALVAAALQQREPASVVSLTLIAPPQLIGDPGATPTQLIIATHDQFCDIEQMKMLVSHWRHRPMVVEIVGADHFLLGASDRVAATVTEFIDRFDPHPTTEP